jgi:hypothetical protein
MKRLALIPPFLVGVTVGLETPSGTSKCKWKHDAALHLPFKCRGNDIKSLSYV